MKNLERLRASLLVKKKIQRPFSIHIPKVDRFPVLYFEGTTEERLQAFQEVNERLYYLIPGKNLHVRPGHTTKMYDYLECQVEDNKEEQINIYFKTVEYLPNICRQLDIPYNPERR